LAAEVSPTVLALYDPTLFALPHPQGFSGSAWLNDKGQTLTNFDWSEPTNWLAISTNNLGADFHRFVITNRLELSRAQLVPQPALSFPMATPMVVPPQKSTLRIEGGLASRRLLSPIELPSWPARTNSAAEPDILTNTVVQAVVDQDGKPISITLLVPSGSGLQAADDYALATARTARFESITRNGLQQQQSDSVENLAWGALIFEWCTQSTTNGP
jgi:hypothetical protein